MVYGYGILYIYIYIWGIDRYIYLLYIGHGGFLIFRWLRDLVEQVGDPKKAPPPATRTDPPYTATMRKIYI